VSVIDERPPRLAWAMWKKFLLAGGLIMLLTGAAVATGALLQVKEVAQIIRTGQPTLKLGAVIDPAEAGKPQTLLILGSDQRYLDRKQHNPSRSDTIILIRLDPNKEATAVMSVPRDLKVDIPHHGTDKINAAYAVGGPKLTVETLKSLLGISINHVVNINFGGFRRVVNYLGCVYVDVDRRYFNNNLGPGPDYATIDIQPGYQKLCGQDALDYVRYRHEDTDLVRAARQQDFLRLAKEQAARKGLLNLGDAKTLTRIVSHYTQTDIKSSDAILRLFKLGILSAGHPIREVHFRSNVGQSYVTASSNQLQSTIHEFLNAQSSKTRGHLQSTPAERKVAKRQKKGKVLVAGLVDGSKDGQDQAIAIANQVPFPVYYPKLRYQLSVYAGPARSYAIRGPDQKLHRAYRMVLKKGIVGEYYGVQGTNWTNPPILDGPSHEMKVAGRKLKLYYDGRRLRLVAWKTPRAVYWISNTLLQTLSDKQMIAIAGSLARLG
jgi:polyisoprenyl-teichoic acid--peptidoglycan teichoic acid transferase